MNDKQTYDLGMVGLGVMGRNLLLNMADRGYAVVGYDKDAGMVAALNQEKNDQTVRGVDDLAQFVRLLRSPRLVMMLVPAGSAVDSVIEDLLPHLAAGDLIIDGGNSHFSDTNLRRKMLADEEISYLGVGISGGEYGARHGPSIMPGGPQAAYDRVRPIFEAIAARVDDEPCVTYLGPGAAGHYVKMVHNGIEYGLMQLIAETYDLMKRGLGLDDNELVTVYQRWNQAELNGFLIEITADIFSQEDDRGRKRLIDMILDAAKQKGTGMWTAQEAMDRHVPAPTIDTAVAMRHLSAMDPEREYASTVLKGPEPDFEGDRAVFLERLRRALYAGIIITFAQGLTALQQGSRDHEFHLNLADVARIWRGGCIIRAALLEKIRRAYQQEPDQSNLLLDPILGQEVVERQEDLRAIVRRAAGWGIPVPGLMISLAYFDAYRSAWLPANLIQAQRDYFGAHTYERIDEKGKFHTEWRRRPETE